ncbi:MAG TPA: hypothetical protein VH833_07865 [Gemmatimonadales bacterium]|jgi:hypothetical protein
MKRLVAAIPVVLLAACILPRYTARWPYRGPMIEVVNPTQDFVALSARDGQGRVITLGTVAPRSKACRMWPFIHDEGWLITDNARRGEGEAMSDGFKPWAFHSWRWTVGKTMEVAQVCGT